MAIKRIVYLTCDGPCGKALEGVSEIPEDWGKLSLQHARESAGNRPSTMALCPECGIKLMALLARAGFGFVAPPLRPDKIEDKEADRKKS